MMVTPGTLSLDMIMQILDTAHEWPLAVRHAASAVRFSPNATRADRQLICDAINARNGAKP